MQKISTMQASGKNIFEGQLTIGLDLGDRSSAYCVLNEAGEIVLEHKLATTPEAMMPRCHIAANGAKKSERSSPLFISTKNRWQDQLESRAIWRL